VPGFAPDRPCLWLRCDATVHNTMYDLFLCTKCDKIRDEAVTGAAIKKTTEVDITTVANLLAIQLKQKRQKADPSPAEPKTRRKPSTRSAAIDISAFKCSVTFNCQSRDGYLLIQLKPMQIKIRTNS